MKEFGITNADLSDYKVIEITNKEEHEYLGDYISSSVIGKRALPSGYGRKDGKRQRCCCRYEEYQLLYIRYVL